MDDPRTPPPPVPAPVPQPPRQLELDRTALERVLMRAAELQATGSDPTELLTEGQLLEIGREVGLQPEHLRQALAEERARLRQPGGSDALSRLVGPGQVHARRVLHGSTEALLAALDAWMQRDQCLQVRRRFQDRILWEPKKGFMSEMQRSLDVGGRGYHLSRAEEVAASVVPAEEGRTLVHLSANLHPSRTNRIVGGSVVAGSGVATTGILLLLGVFAPVAAGAALVGAGSGWLIARAHGPRAARVHLALEQILDRLERGELPRGGLLDNLKSLGKLRDS